ncbi:MAG TPA: hypothetical protein VF834_18720 [Streptosporangiaceae bacterium]
MTEPRDPIESWLSTDVELLSPPPGAFQAVARRARRRKVLRAASSVAGAAVIIAGVAVLPRIASGIFSGQTGPARVVVPSSQSSGTLPGHRTANPWPRTSSPVSLPASHGPALSSVGTGAGPAAGFRPSSVTFVGTSLGAVIGEAGSSCGAGPCVVAAGTPDYGRRWYKIGSPAAGPPSGSTGVSQIRFLDPVNGWAYGPALYATHNGGVTWKAVDLPGRVIDLSTVSGRAFAVVATCAGNGPDYAAQCTSFALYSAPSASDQWRRVRGAAAALVAVPGGLQLTRSQGYVLAGGHLFTGPVTGGAWHQVRVTQPGAPPCLLGGQNQAAGQRPALIAPAGSELFLACAGSSASPASSAGQPGPLTLYLSADSGQAWQAQGTIAAHGTATSLAAIPGAAIVLATTSGLYYSYDARHWQQGTIAGGAPQGGFRFVGMTNAQQGVAVPSDSGGHRLFITGDGGRTWQPSPIG